LLFEVTEDGARVAHLRRTLELDSGYLSRLLRQLEDDGLVTVTRDPDDGRQRVVHLTAGGRRARARLDERSQQLAARLIEPLAPRLRARLIAALDTAERILRSATVRFSAVDPRSPAAQTALGRYFAELDDRFASGFDPGHGGATGDAQAFTPPDGIFFVMTSDDEVIGCGGVHCLDETTAEIKRMWVHDDWRGLGLGARLLGRLEAESAELGRTRVVLDTNEALAEAIAMYRRSGYHAIERYSDNPYAHHWFEKVLRRRDVRTWAGSRTAR
jgi:DNA-binding MarR family transcriptional regulator/GNAT superfamily N-acetyltransferase